MMIKVDMDLWKKYEEKCVYGDVHGTEESFYSSFENLLDNSFLPEEDYVVINNPRSDKKKRKIGHPDFEVSYHGIPMINIEAKPPKKDVLQWLKNPATNPESLHLSDQIHKYRIHKDTIILVTDFRTIWWVDIENLKDDLEKPIPILRKFSLLKEDLSLYTDHKKEWDKLINLLKLDVDSAKSKLEDLIHNIMPFVKDLKKEMARIMNGASRTEEKALRKHLIDIRSDLKKTLFAGTEDFAKQFIDLYTQLVAYGMFMGWLRYHKNTRKRRDFHIDSVSQFLPRNSLLQNLFTGITNNMTDHLYDTIFDPMQKWFNKTEYIDITFRLDELMNEFYSGFLEAYDKELKDDMGVVYTPEEVVDFTIRGVDYFLKEKFGLENGAVEDVVKYLDTSAGTMAYPCGLMKYAYEKFRQDVLADPLSTTSSVEEKFSEWFRNSFLRRDDGSFGNVFGFELLMSPYILGSIRTLMMAEKFGVEINYKLDRVQLYLLNTLMDIPEDESIETFLAPLNNAKVKSELEQGLEAREKKDIMVVMSNPPYNIGSKQNESKWITELVDEYVQPPKNAPKKWKEKLHPLKRECDQWYLDDEGKLQHIEEYADKPRMKKITGLKSAKSDYWKFLRFSQWKISENNERGGMIAYITNNFYLDGLVARGMRKELRRAFDEIYIVNLHGDWKKKTPERAEGKDDENIFGVDCGVAIAFMIRYEKDRHQNHKEGNPFRCEVKYTEYWGNKQQRLDDLKVSNIEEMEFEDCGENHDFEFTPYIESDADYDRFPYLCEIFRENIQGVVTGNDDWITNVEEEILIENMRQFFENNVYVKRKSIDYIKQKEKTNLNHALTSFQDYQYRGFDKRRIVYDPPLLVRDRWELMQYFLPYQENVGLISVRQSGKDLDSSYFISNNIVECKCMEGASGLANYIFPLKINISKEPDTINNPKPAIHSNLNPQFMTQIPYWEEWESLSDEVKMSLSEQVFYYIYGILYTPTYRENYNGLLIKDFPRIPFPLNGEFFERMSDLGKELASYHLMTHEHTQDLTRQETTIRDLEMPRGTYSVKIGKARWIEYRNNPFTPEGDENMGVLCFNSKRRSKDGVKYDAPDPKYLMIHNIPKDVWEFEIGGRKQLEDWLNSRRYSTKPKKNYMTRGLNKEELSYFIHIINAIEDTLAILPNLDEVYSNIESDVFEVSIEEEDEEDTLLDF